MTAQKCIHFFNVFPEWCDLLKIVFSLSLFWGYFQECMILQSVCELQKAAAFAAAAESLCRGCWWLASGNDNNGAFEVLHCSRPTFSDKFKTYSLHQVYWKEFMFVRLSADVSLASSHLAIHKPNSINKHIIYCKQAHWVIRSLIICGCFVVMIFRHKLVKQRHIHFYNRVFQSVDN